MIYGFCGIAGAGKDTAARFLRDRLEERGRTVEIMHFADPLKDALSVLFGWKRECLSGLTEDSRNFRERVDWKFQERCGMSIVPRTIMQKFGQAMKEVTGYPDFWAALMKNRIKLSKAQDIIIPDVRFLEEISMIKKIGGKVYCVERGTPKQVYGEDYHNIMTLQSLIEEEYGLKNLEGTKSLIYLYKGKIKTDLSEYCWFTVKKFLDGSISNLNSLDELKFSVRALVR